MVLGDEVTVHWLGNVGKDVQMDNVHGNEDEEGGASYPTHSLSWTHRSRRGPRLDLSYHKKFHLPMNF